MLKKMRTQPIPMKERPIGEVPFPTPFDTGLQYNPPARGVWNIVHTGMLIPGAHQIFACAQGCLRGVILTAAEMNAMDRMSWISVCENDMFSGDLEQNIVDGTADILNKMDALPPVVLLYLSCIHFFAGIDFDRILSDLRAAFPSVDFVDCYMTPTMRTTESPDQIMRRQLYAALRPLPVNPRSVNILGNDLATSPTSELLRIIEGAGCQVRDITDCHTYGEYLAMGESALNITCLPAARAGGEQLSQRLDRPHLYLPLCYDAGELLSGYQRLADALGTTLPDFSALQARAEKKLDRAREVIGTVPVTIDYTATPRPLGLAKLLTEHGFAVERLYIDVFSTEEEEAFHWLQVHAPELTICPTLDPAMRFANHGDRQPQSLAIGQKAAYFEDTRHFVNLVNGGGLYGFDGIGQLADLIIDAWEHEKETQTVIQYKGIQCESCL